MAASAGAVGRAVNGEGAEGGGSRTTSVSVDDSETWVESKRYTVYKVVVRKADKAYFVFRRFVSEHGAAVCVGSSSFRPLFRVKNIKHVHTYIHTNTVLSPTNCLLFSVVCNVANTYVVCVCVFVCAV